VDRYSFDVGLLPPLRRLATGRRSVCLCRRVERASPPNGPPVVAAPDFLERDALVALDDRYAAPRRRASAFWPQLDCEHPYVGRGVDGESVRGVAEHRDVDGPAIVWWRVRVARRCGRHEPKPKRHSFPAARRELEGQVKVMGSQNAANSSSIRLQPVRPGFRKRIFVCIQGVEPAMRLREHRRLPIVISG
jgi:hypothetical protein